MPGLDDRLGYRVAVQQYRSDGFRHDAFLGRDDTYNRDELTARGKLRWRPAPGWQADLTGMFVDLDNGYDAWAIDNSFTTQSDQPGQDTQRTSAGSLRVTGHAERRGRRWSASPASRTPRSSSASTPTGATRRVWAPDVYDYTQRTDRDRRTLNQELRLVSGPGGTALRPRRLGARRLRARSDGDQPDHRSRRLGSR